MLHIYKPMSRSVPALTSYDGSLPTTPVLPFNETIESLNRNVYPKPLHSHNDYWRIHPLFDALSAGAVSIESDVWVFANDYELQKTVTETTDDGVSASHVETQYFNNKEVYVGHNQVYLRPINTLFNLYLNPLFQFLQSSNPNFTFTDQTQNTPGASPLQEAPGTKQSVFYNSPETPVYLWFDVKADANLTYQAIRPLLQPFIDNNYLAYYNSTNDTYVPGPLILTFTGNLPTELVSQEAIRYTFLDGNLTAFANGGADNATLTKISKLSRVASGSAQSILGDADFAQASYANFTDSQKAKLNATFALAHQYGVKTRVWGDITWPVNLVNSHLQDYFTLKSDLLNVDDVQAATKLF